MLPTPDIDTIELVSALKREYDSADNYWSELRDEQYLAQRFYEAKPFGNEVDGQSQVVLPDVQETVDNMAIAVLRTFASGDRVVEIEATDEADEELADEATAAIGYSFMRQQDGYRILHDWATSGLLEKIGITKSMMVTEEKVVRQRVQITDPVEVELAGAEIEGEPEPQPDGTFIANVRQEKRVRRSVDITVPASEFRFSRLARNEDDADYLAHVCLKTRSELVEMGFDRDQVYSLPANGRLPDSYDDRDEFGSPDSTPALEEVLLCEEYARIDIDGDGIAERVQVFRVENEILVNAGGELAIDVVEDQPFTVFCPFPKPHQLVGYSLADKVMDVQLLRSTIARQLMDGMRNANLPRPIVDTQNMDENTIDDLLSPIAGAPIRVRGAQSVVPYQTSFDVGKSLSVMEWVSREGEARSGTSRTAPVLDADTLNTQTATEYAGNKEDGAARQEFVARNLAEAFARLVVKKYRMLRREGEPFKIKVDGQYKLVDPSRWPEEININIRVGLGTGSKDKRIQGRMALVPLMAEGAQQGKVSDKHLFNMFDGLVRDMGLGQGDDYWRDPDAPPEIDPQTGQPKQEPDQPDPEMLAMQAEQQREQQKLDLEREKTEAQLLLKKQSDEANLGAMREKHALEMEQKREAAALEAQLAREKADAEYALEIYRIDRQSEVQRHAATLKADTDVHLSENRPGGALDA